MLKKSGLTVKAVDIEILSDALPASTVITSVEALWFHQQYLEDQRDGYGENVLERLEAGREYSAIDLANAFFVRRKTEKIFRDVFQEVDCLVGATLPCLPPPVGATQLRSPARRKALSTAWYE